MLGYNKTMLNAKGKKAPGFTLALAFSFVLVYFIFLQFISPVFYGEDSYYHAAVSGFIKSSGPWYNFRWAQFSTFRYFFSDKDILFHFLTVPFLFFTDNPVLAGKCAVVFFNLLFLSLYVFILRRYVSSSLAGLILLLPVCSATFSLYFLYLRPAILENIFILLGIYFLINKKWVKLLFLSLFYPLAHVSFFMMIFLAFLCEIIRCLIKKEFFFRNISVVITGILLGCFLHPNFPNNLLSVYLNSFMVPFYSLKGMGLELGGELISAPAKFVLMGNPAVFLTFILILGMAFYSGVRASFATFVWWASATVYLGLGFLLNRFWYPANVLFFVFFASFLKDWAGKREWEDILPKSAYFITVYAAVVFFASAGSFDKLKGAVRFYSENNAYYEDSAVWMRDNIPAGETIYHASWAVSPFFICLNPKDNYFVALDPVYMYYPYPREYETYAALRKGEIAEPYAALKDVFKVNYGYTEKDNGLYRQISGDPDHFKILHENTVGVVFKLVTDRK